MLPPPCIYFIWLIFELVYFLRKVASEFLKTLLFSFLYPNEVLAVRLDFGITALEWFYANDLKFFDCEVNYAGFRNELVY